MFVLLLLGYFQIFSEVGNLISVQLRRPLQLSLMWNSSRCRCGSTLAAKIKLRFEPELIFLGFKAISAKLPILVRLSKHCTAPPCGHNQRTFKHHLKCFPFEISHLSSFAKSPFQLFFCPFSSFGGKVGNCSHPENIVDRALKRVEDCKTERVAITYIWKRLFWQQGGSPLF